MVPRERSICKQNGMFECPSCYNQYKWKKSMLTHLRYQCKQPPRFECKYCPAKNYQKAHIVRHLHVHHSHLSPMFFDRKHNATFRLWLSIRSPLQISIVMPNKVRSWISNWMVLICKKNLINALWKIHNIFSFSYYREMRMYIKFL